jgi:hypothetical protein
MASAETGSRAELGLQGFGQEGEDPDAALAKLMQEQEHAWFLANGGSVEDLDFHDSDTEMHDRRRPTASVGSMPLSTLDNGSAGCALPNQNVVFPDMPAYACQRWLKRKLFPFHACLLLQSMSTT